MTKIDDSQRPRRRFLAQIGAGAAVLAGAAGATSSLGAQAARRIDDSPHDHWLRDLNGKHRQFFHIISPNINALLPVRNFLDVYAEEYRATPGDLNAVVGLMGAAIAVAMRDEMWTKYSLGTVASFTDPATKQPATRNLIANGGSATVEVLRDRGVRFLVCNMTMKFLAETIAKQVSSTAEAVYADFKTSLLPGMIVVPAMIIAINRAQERGLTYSRLS